MKDYLVLDFETHYDKDYSLKKMPTAQYVRDERFQILGVAYRRASFPSSRPAWAEGHDAAVGNLNALPPDIPVVGHNLGFDALVLMERVLPPHRVPKAPPFFLDTMLMARYCISQGVLPPDVGTSLAALARHFGLPEKGDTGEAVDAGGEALAEYARHDVWLTEQILHKLMPHCPAMELKLMDLHVRMATDAVLSLDAELCEAEIEANTMPEDLKKACGSNDKFAALLRKAGVEPETKTSERTGKEAFAFAKTDAFMQRLLSDKRPVVRKLAELRLQSKSNLAKNRAERFLLIGSPFPVPLLYYGAHTGRGSGQDKLNMQNLPGGGRLRRALKAPPGHKLVICDSGQIEVRVLAWLAGEHKLLDICRQADAGEGPDIYVSFSSEHLYGVSPNEVTAKMRKDAKPVVLAGGFGQGANGLMNYAQAVFGIEMEASEAQRNIDAYRQGFPAIVRHWRHVMDAVRANQQTVLPNGRKLTYPNLRYEGRELWYEKHSIFSSKYVGKRDKVKLWHGLAVENEVQATARDVVMWQTLQLAKRWRVVLSVHDEVVLCVPEDQAEQAKQEALEWFATAPPWAEGLPLIGEAVISDDYGEKP